MKNFYTSKIIGIFIILAVTASLLINSALLFAQTTQTIPLIINEIGVKEISDEEWIEVLNISTGPIDLKDLKFYEDQTNHGLTVFRGSSVIAPGEFAVIANKADRVASKYPEYLGTLFDSSWGTLKEDGEEIGLKDTSGNFVELFSYPLIQGTSLSLERIDATVGATEATNWAAHPSLHSLGKPNENALPAQTIEPVTESSPEHTQTTTSSPEPELPPEPNPLPPQTSEPIIQASPPPPLPPPPPPPPQSSIVYQTAPPPNSPPKAIIQVQSGSLIAVNSTTINFDGRASFDPNGEKLTYLWDMGDKTQETTANPSPHKYSKPGTYHITLTVSDPSGLHDTADEYVYVVKTQSQQATLPAGAITSASLQSTPASEPSTNAKIPFSIPLTTKVDLMPSLSFTLSGFLTLEPSENVAKKSQPKATKKKPQKKKPAQVKSHPARARQEKRTKKSTVKKKKTSKNQILFNNGDLSDDIRITEIMPNPDSKSEEEWIELFNSGREPINLGNWKLVNTAVRSAGYSIRSTTIIEAGAYLLFPQSETHLKLKNSSDRLLLYDFEGNGVDTVFYETTQKGKSYALVTLENASDLVASRETIESRVITSWEWLPKPTPGAPNPIFLELSGVVQEVGEDENQNAWVTLHTHNGEIKKVYVPKSTLDPRMASVVLSDGTSLRVRAEEQEDGSYVLQKIQEVKQKPTKEKGESKFFWIFIAFIAAGILFNVPALLRGIRDYIKKRN